MNSLDLYENNNYEHIYNYPLTFIDNLESRKHIVLYYENQEFSKEIQFRFIRNGLIKGENCIYVTNNDNTKLIENDMRNHGINVDKFNKKGLLHIYKIPEYLLKYPKDVIEKANEFLDAMLSNITQPFRIVGRLIDEITTEEQIQANMALEQIFHSKFEQLNGIVLCHYDINKNIFDTNGKWMETILENHHQPFLLPTIRKKV